MTSVASASRSSRCLRPGDTMVVTACGCVSMAVRKSLHLALLVHDVVGEEQPAGVDAREHHVEELLVVRLPGVQEHEVERALELRDFLERVACDDRDDVGEAGALDVGAASLARTGSYSMVISVRRSRAGPGRSRWRCSRWRRRSRGPRLALVAATSRRRKRPSSSETASWPLSAARIVSSSLAAAGATPPGPGPGRTGP